MSVIDDALSAILKGANPSASDDDIASQVAGLKQSGGEAVNQALSFIPGLNSMKDIASNAPAIVSNPVVQGMANGVTGAPLAPNVPNPGNPISGLAQGAVTGAVAPTSPSLPETMNIPELPDISKNFQFKNGMENQPTPPPPAAPTSAPTATSQASSPVGKDDSSIANALTASSNDADARNKANAEAMSRRKLAGIPAAIAGVGDAIASGASAFGVKAPTDIQDKLLDRAKANFEESKTLFDEKLKNDPNSDVSKSYRTMVTQIAPTLANNPNFQNMTAQSIGEKLPLIDTMMKAQAAKDEKEMGLKQLQSNKDISLGLREDQQQDKLEGQAMQRINTLRGDQSLARIENQRDAAISAYRTLQIAKDEKRMPSQAEYYDILGQLWKARTGATPSDAAIRDLDSKTFQGSLQKAGTYFTGKPMGNTTPAILDNLQQFVKHTGNLADEQHDAYMKPHMIKPTGLSDERWKPIVSTARGISFADGIKAKQNTESNNDPLGLGL